MSNLNEDILNQIRLMGYDRSKILSEQKPDNLMPFQSDYGLRPNYTPSELVKNAEKISNERSQLSKSFSNIVTEDNIDLAISILSTAFQVVPGLGTVIGTVIEVLHAISYFIRFFTESDGTKKWEYFINGIIEFAFVLIPLPVPGSGANNIIKILKGELDKVKYATPKWFLEFFGIKGISLTKPIKPKYLIKAFLIKLGINISRESIIKAILKFRNHIDDICNNWKLKMLLPSSYFICELLNSTADKIEENLDEFDEISKGADEFLKEIKNKSKKPDNTKKCDAYKKWESSKDKTNAGTIQQLMIDLGHNITLDYKFGDETAKAIGTYVYGSSKGIDSVDSLWKQMKKDGWDVGDKSGYGPKMSKEVSNMLSKIINTDKKNLC